MKALRNMIVILMSVMTTFPASAQKAEELQRSYNYQRGYELLYGDKADESGALASFQKEVAEHPKNGYAYYFMAQIYDTRNQEGDALGCINKAVELLRKDKGWITYAYRMRARIYLKLDHEDLALKDWKAGLKENPKDVQALYDRAELYYYKDQYDLADADYDAMIAAEPGNTLGYKGKGRNAIARKDYQKAVDLFSYCINLDPSESMSYGFRAEAYMGLKKYNEATDDIVKALAIDSEDKAFRLMQTLEGKEKDLLLAKFRIEQAKDKNNYFWPYYQGIVYESNDEFHNAIKSYKQANDIDASDYMLNRIAICYSECGEYGLALDYINKALAMDSTETEYLSTKGNILYMLGRKEECLAVYDKLVSLQPDNSNVYYERGFKRDNMGDIDGAIEDYTTSIVLDPSMSASYLNRAEMYRKKGNEDAAVADYKKVVEIDTLYTSDCCAQYAYLALGNKAKAIEIQDSILAKSSDKDDLYNAACLYSKMGDGDKAMAYLRQAFEKGFRDFTHVMNDDDMDGVKGRDDFKSLMNEYRQKVSLQEEQDGANVADGVAGQTPQRISEIPFTRESGGLCKVKCDINGLPLNFWLDTGASDVTLSMVEATFMVKNGYLTKDDVVGSSYFLDANGNVSEGTVVNLRTVRFGDSELTNVKASVVKNLKAPLLLGQSVLARLGSVEIDNAKQVIRIRYYK